LKRLACKLQKTGNILTEFIAYLTIKVFEKNNRKLQMMRWYFGVHRRQCRDMSENGGRLI